MINSEYTITLESTNLVSNPVPETLATPHYRDTCPGCRRGAAFPHGHTSSCVDEATSRNR